MNLLKITMGAAIILLTTNVYAQDSYYGQGYEKKEMLSKAKEQREAQQQKRQEQQETRQQKRQEQQEVRKEKRQDHREAHQQKRQDRRN